MLGNKWLRMLYQMDEADGSGGGTTPQPTDWEASYKALQKTHQQALAAANLKVTSFEEKLTAFEGEKQGYLAKISEFEKAQADSAKKIADYDAQVKKVSEEKAAAEKNAARYKLLATKFPELAGFESQGLLPDAPDETTMVERFTAFQTTLRSLGKDAAKNAVDSVIGGVTPAGVGSSTQTKSPRSRSAIMDAMRGKDPASPEYAALEAEYDATFK